MMRHVSVFRVKPEFRTPEVLDILEKELYTVSEKVPQIIETEIGRKPFPMPTESPDGHVMFYDLIQIITFASPEDCMSYPASQGHLDFLASSSKYMEQVIGLDYPVD